MPNNLVACRVASYRPFEAIALEHLRELGIRHVEIPVPPPEGLEKTIAALQRFDLSASTLQGSLDLSQDNIAQQVESQMAAFHALNCSRLFVSVKAGDTPFELACRRLREAGETAARHRVVVLAETHPDLFTNGDVAARTLAQVGHSNLKLNYDPANIYFYNQSVDAVEELFKVVDHVGAVHLKDTDGGYRHWHFPALGRGVVNFPRMLTALDDHGFTGPLTLEIEGIEGETKTERLITSRIAESVGYLRGLGRL